MRTFARGRYRVVDEIAHGRFATIYRATDTTQPGEEVALKVLTVDGSHRDLTRAMFRKEVEALGALVHPRVVRLLDSFEEPEVSELVLVLQLVGRGENLEQAIRSKPAAPPLRWRLAELLAICGALDAAHRKNIIHRDVKPSNLLVDGFDGGELRLADFGIARLLENYGRAAPGVTTANFYTRPYAAPEQVLKGDATPASDLHAFGVLAAVVLAWRLPPDDLHSETLDAFLEPLRRDLPDPKMVEMLAGLVRRLLAPKTRMRPRIQEVLNVLESVHERTLERRSVGVVLTNKAKSAFDLHGFASHASALDDLSSRMRARYEPQPDDPRAPFSIVVLGGRLRARLVSSSEPNRLLVIDVVQPEPTLHARERERAVPVPFLLGFDGGSAEPFVQTLYDAYQAEQRAIALRRKRAGLVELARKVVAIQSEHLRTSSLSYRLLDERPAQKFGDLLRAKLGTLPSAPEPPPASGAAKVGGEYVHVEILALLDEEASDEQRAAMLTTWHDAADETSVVTADRLRLGTFHAYDSAARVLAIRRDRDLTGMAREGVLEVFDLRAKAAVDRLERALEDFEDGAAASGELGDLLVFPERNRLEPLVPRVLCQPLEPEERMRDLVARILAARDFFLLQGPPGTGKTTVIAEVVTHILAQDPCARILLTSQANEAVDHAISEARTLAASLGRRSRMFRDTPTERGARGGPPSDPAYALWLDETRRASAAGFDELSPSMSDGQRDAVRRVVERWQERMGRTVDVQIDYLASVQVIGATCLRVPAVAKYLRDDGFDWVIVDEAARATTAEVMVALVCGKRFLLVGDQKQLPPYLSRETEADLREHDIDPARAKRSLFEDLFDKVPETNRASLRRQFRMHSSIANVVSELFYADIGGLENGVPDEARAIALPSFDGPHRIFWLDVRGVEEPQGTSWYNESEVDVVVSTLGTMNAELAGESTPYQVAVIAAYAAQIEKLRRAIAPRLSTWDRLSIRTATVDAFQGKQADVVLYSMARLGDEERRFLADPHRLNVAFSRAKRLVVVVGHAETARRSALLARLLDRVPGSNVRHVEAAR